MVYSHLQMDRWCIINENKDYTNILTSWLSAMNIIISDFFSASCFKLKQTCQTRYTFDPNGSLVFHQCMIKWQNHFFLILINAEKLTLQIKEFQFLMFQFLLFVWESFFLYLGNNHLLLIVRAMNICLTFI